MANQAFGRADDILFGSGELFISLDDDTEGWKHLGNVDEFTIITDVEAIEKNTSMGTKRELLERTTTALSITAEATLTEYDYKNLAIALFGKAEISKQEGIRVVNQQYYVRTLPGIISLTDSNNNRFYDVTISSIVPNSQILDNVRWQDSNGFGDITTVNSYNDTFTAYHLGGTITLNLSGARISKQIPIYVCIVKEPDAPGDLNGMEVLVRAGTTGNINRKTFTTGVSDYIQLQGGIEIIFSVAGNKTFSVMSDMIDNGIKAIAIPPLTQYVSNIDYIADKQSCRAGMIKLPTDSRIRVGDTLNITYLVPERNLCVVRGGDAKDLKGKLLFVSDANSGPNYVIECWKVHIYPEGDLAGLISNGDFGSYKIKFSLNTDYKNHPESPFYTMTLVDYGQQDIKYGIYDAEY